MPKLPRRHAAADVPKPSPEPDVPPTSRFERAFCSLVAYERPRRLLQLMEEQKEILTCDCERFFRLASIQFTQSHPHFRQAARCAEILTGEPVADIFCVHVAGDADADEIELAVMLVGTRRWSSTIAVNADRFAGAWLEARGDER